MPTANMPAPAPFAQPSTNLQLSQKATELHPFEPGRIEAPGLAFDEAVDLAGEGAGKLTVTLWLAHDRRIAVAVETARR